MDDDRTSAAGADEDAAEDLAVPDEQAEDVTGGVAPPAAGRNLEVSSRLKSAGLNAKAAGMQQKLGEVVANVNASQSP